MPPAPSSAMLTEMCIYRDDSRVVLPCPSLSNISSSLHQSTQLALGCEESVLGPGGTILLSVNLFA